MTSAPAPLYMARRGDIQGLRALAVLLVVIYHTDLALSGGYIGVDVFFVISGFVITGSLRNELASTGSLRLGRFYLRRIRRLLPALAVMLGSVALLSTVLAPIGGLRLSARTGAAASLFNANNYLLRQGEGGYFTVDAETDVFLHTWSLSLEEQYYLFFPALIALLWFAANRLGWSTRLVAYALVALGAVSFALSLMATNGNSGFLPIGDFVEQFAFYSLPTRAWEFVAGAVIALWAPTIAAGSRRVAGWAAVAGGLLVIGAATVFDDRTPFPGGWALLPVVGTMLLIIAGTADVSNPVSRLLSLGPAQTLGDLSYSWYLWHWPFIVWAGALWGGSSLAVITAAIVSIVPAVASYRWVENPLRYAPGMTTRKTLALAATAIVLPLGAAAVLWSSAGRLDRSDNVAEFERATRPHLDLALGCSVPVPIGDRDNPDCTVVTERSGGAAYLVGDSNAGHFSEAFVGATERAGMSATLATMDGCPFVDLVMVVDDEPNDECARFVQSSLQDLIGLRPSLVVIASTQSHIESGRIEFMDPRTGAVIAGPDEKARAWSDGLVRVVGPLVEAGSRIEIIHPVAEIPDWDARESAALRWLTDPGSCGADVARADALQQRDRTVEAERAATADLERAGTIDLFDVLCPASTCSTNIGDFWQYRDSDHISVDGSLLLVDDLYESFSVGA